MKTKGLISVFALASLLSFGQSTEKLFGAHWNGSGDIFTSVDLLNNTYSTVSVFTGTFSSVMGLTTYDDISNRYFIGTAGRILIINAITGAILDTIPISTNFNNFEYDPGANRLVGLSYSGGAEHFVSIDLSTKIGYNISTLNGVSGISAGESTFDPLTRRYFTKTNLGINVIDTNGVILSTFNAPNNFLGIEFNPLNNKLFGSYWNGSAQVFCSLDPSNGDFEPISNLDGVSGIMQGYTTFDKTLGHYFFQSNAGILKVDAMTGGIMQTYNLSNGFAGIEFKSFPKIETTGIKVEINKNKILVFPNPGNDHFYFSNIDVGSKIRISDTFGKLIYETVSQDGNLDLNLEGKTKGIYFFSIHNNKQIEQGKIILR